MKLAESGSYYTGCDGEESILDASCFTLEKEKAVERESSGCT